MKQYFKIFTTVILFSIFLISCDEDEMSIPVIQNIEIGTNNSKLAYIGGDLHIEAEILADAKIASIRLLIHQEEEGAEDALAQKVISVTEHTDEWVLDSTYTGVYAGVKNTTFHEHVEISSNALTGTYHLHLYVTDLDGNQTLIEEEFSIVTPVADGSLPIITINSAPSQNQVFSNGQTITVSGNITDVKGLSGTYIGLVKVSQGLTDAQVGSSNTITLLHFHDFTDPKNYSFSASIKVGDAKDNDLTAKDATWTPGDYYILVKAPGLDGEVGFSAHYPITIQ